MCSMMQRWSNFRTTKSKSSGSRLRMLSIMQRTCWTRSLPTLCAVRSKLRTPKPAELISCGTSSPLWLRLAPFATQSMESKVKEMIAKLEAIAQEKDGLGWKHVMGRNRHQDQHSLLWWMSPVCTAGMKLRRRWWTACFLITQEEGGHRCDLHSRHGRHRRHRQDHTLSASLQQWLSEGILRLESMGLCFHWVSSSRGNQINSCGNRL